MTFIFALLLNIANHSGADISGYAAVGGILCMVAYDVLIIRKLWR